MALSRRLFFYIHGPISHSEGTYSNEYFCEGSKFKVVYTLVKENIAFVLYDVSFFLFLLIIFCMIMTFKTFFLLITTVSLNPSTLIILYGSY